MRILATILFSIIILIYLIPWRIVHLLPSSDNPLFEKEHELWITIAKSDITGEYEELYNFCTTDHGDFYNQAIMSDLIDWGLMNRYGFLNLVKLLEERKITEAWMTLLSA